jgi:FemAB-related protein (PEP-CTERM system-associated)
MTLGKIVDPLSRMSANGVGSTFGDNNSDIKIIHCSDDHQIIWDNFLDYQSDASFYHLYYWRAINKTNFGHKTYYLAATNNDSFIGIFPLVFLNSHIFGKILCSLPFVNYGGPCCINEAVESKLLQEAIDIAKDCNVDYLELRTKKIVDNSLHTSTHKISMTLELDSDPDIIWNQFSSKHRTNIRRVYKNNINVTTGGIEYLDTFYDLLVETWRDLGTPIYKKDYFYSILNSFPELTRIFICSHKNNPIAAAFNGYYKNTVEGMWAAAPVRFRSLQPNYVMYWEMIKDACERGFNKYHLGRSTVDSGGEQFKKKWNAVQTQLYWQYYLCRASKIPQLNVQNKKYKTAIKIWRKLPISLTAYLGPILARSIP